MNIYDAWGNHKTIVLDNGQFVDISTQTSYTQSGLNNKTIALLNPFRYRSYYYDEKLADSLLRIICNKIFTNGENSLEIKLESNRHFLFKLFIPFVLLLSMALIGLFIYIIVSSSNSISLIISTIIVCVIDIVYISIIITLKVKKKPIFVFKNDQIIYFKKNNKITIKVNDIKTMIYVSNKWYDFILYIFIILLGDSGGFNMPMLKIIETNGKEHLLGYFSKQDIMKLKKLYFDLLVVK